MSLCVSCIYKPMFNNISLVGTLVLGSVLHLMVIGPLGKTRGSTNFETREERTVLVSGLQFSH